MPQAAGGCQVVLKLIRKFPVGNYGINRLQRESGKMALGFPGYGRAVEAAFHLSNNKRYE